jgi:hypothetical protein
MRTSGVISRACSRRRSCSCRCWAAAEAPGRAASAAAAADATACWDACCAAAADEEPPPPPEFGTPLIVEQNGQRMWSTRWVVINMPLHV